MPVLKKTQSKKTNWMQGGEQHRSEVSPGALHWGQWTSLLRESSPWSLPAHGAASRSAGSLSSRLVFCPQKLFSCKSFPLRKVQGAFQIHGESKSINAFSFIIVPALHSLKVGTSFHTGMILQNPGQSQKQNNTNPYYQK